MSHIQLSVRWNHLSINALYNGLLVILHGKHQIQIQIYRQPKILAHWNFALFCVITFFKQTACEIGEYMYTRQRNFVSVWVELKASPGDESVIITLKYDSECHRVIAWDIQIQLTARQETLFTNAIGWYIYRPQRILCHPQASIFHRFVTTTGINIVQWHLVRQ